MDKTKEVTYTYNINNSQPTDDTYNILGASYNGEDISDNATPGLNITVPESSTKQAQRENQVTNFKIVKMMIRTSNVDQLNNEIIIKTLDATGRLEEIPLSLPNFENPGNAQDKLLELSKDTGFAPIDVWGNVGFTGTIKANTKMSLTITFKYQYRPGLSGFTGETMEKILKDGGMFSGYPFHHGVIISDK